MSTTEHPVLKAEESPVSPPQPVEDLAQKSRLTKLKTALLYVLIGALVASAIIAVLALLLGDEFSASMGRSLQTIFILFTHSLLILALLWADTRNQVGRKLLPTTILVLTFANMITTMLGTWDIIDSESAWRALGLYFLILGTVYVIVGTLQLRIKHTATLATLYASVTLMAITTLALTPWVLDLFSPLDELYFRIVAALSIVTATTYMIAIIIRGIALGQNPALKATRPISEPTPTGLLVIYITLGTITGLVWSVGMMALLISGVQATNSTDYSETQAPVRSKSYY